MTQEEKQLLLKDFSARLPYGVIVHNEEGNDGHLNSINQTIFGIELGVNITSIHRVDFQLDTCKPYLRPMSSMTEEERNEATQFEINNLGPIGFNWYLLISNSSQLVDWLNKKMFDYRGLIEKCLALEAPDGMYKSE